MKAVRKFKALIAHKRPPAMSSILGESDSSRMSLPPLSISAQRPRHPSLKHKPRSLDVYDRNPVEGALTAEGVHRTIDPGEEVHPSLQSLIIAEKNNKDDPLPEAGFLRREATASPDIDDAFLPFRPNPTHGQAQQLHGHTVDVLGHRGHAHDPLEDHLFLHIGPSTFAGDSGAADRRGSFMPDEDDAFMVSESPGAADVDIYETAYRDEIERIKARLRHEGKDEEPHVYLTRRVDAKLMALGGLAGRLRSMGEGGLERVGDIKAIKEGRIKVSGMSRALRSAAREEYERHRAERIARHQHAADAAAAAEEKHLADNPRTENDQPTNGQNKRILRNAVKEEYERHKGERKTRHQPSGGASVTSLEGETSYPPQAQEDDAQEPQRKRPSLTFMTNSPLAEKAWEKSRQAKSSFKDILGRMKDRGGSGGSGGSA